MKQKEYARKILKKTGLKLQEVKVLPANMLYLTLYHIAHAFNSMGKYELSVQICKALLKEIKRT